MIRLHPTCCCLLQLLCLFLFLLAPAAQAAEPLSLYIAANFHNNEATVPGFVTETSKLARQFGPPSLFITVYESDSTDRTTELLHAARGQFTKNGIDHNITTHGALVRGRRSRIDFLADARNELLKPLRAMAPDRKFDYVVFLNDILFVAEDVIKLLAVGGDVSCGTDFIPIGDANAIYRPPVDEAYPIFYDAWVARTLDGLPLRAMPPYVPPQLVVPTLKRVADAGLAFPDYTRVANMLELAVTPAPEIVQLQCCWNGVVVVRAAPFYRGLSFRSNLPGECAGSECSHFCADMWALNYTRFTMHHGVRVAYEAATWERAKALALPYTPVQLPFEFADTRLSRPVLCCGEHRIVRLPSYARLAGESTPAFVYRVWLTLNELPPDDDLLALLADFVGNETLLDTETLRSLLSDEPRAPCVMQPLVSLVSRVCLSGAGRAIPLIITQAGTEDAREALIPYAATWKTLHPDHQYAYVNVDGGKWDGVPSGPVSVAQRLLRAGHTGLAADVVRAALLYYRGGIVAELGTAVEASVSCEVADDDELVDVFAKDVDTSFLGRAPPTVPPAYPHPIAVAATPRHPVVLARLNRAMQRAAAVLGDRNGMAAMFDKDLVAVADDDHRHGVSSASAPRALTIVAHVSGVPVMVRGQGPRAKRLLDATARA